MNALYWTIRNFVECPREEGQTLTEYALILVLIAIVAIAVLMLMGPQIASIYSSVSSSLTF